MFFVKHLHIVLEMEGSNMLTLSPATSLQKYNLLPFVVTLSCLILIKRDNHVAPVATQLMLPSLFQ